MMKYSILRVAELNALPAPDRDLLLAMIQQNNFEDCRHSLDGKHIILKWDVSLKRSPCDVVEVFHVDYDEAAIKNIVATKEWTTQQV